MYNKLLCKLEQHYKELTPQEFYRLLFPIGELDKDGAKTKGKYTAIAVEIEKDNKIKRHTITDELTQIDTLLQSDNFIFLSPISYCGKSRAADNARYIYAITIDLDGITDEGKINDFFHQIKNDIFPTPSYVVASGTGLHLYYHLETPEPCYSGNIKILAFIKKQLTAGIWNSYITSLHDNIQFESLFQGFRLVGGITKDKKRRTRAFVFGDRVNIKTLWHYAEERAKAWREDIPTIDKKTSIENAKKMFPDWHEKRILQGQKRKGWITNKAVYNWWLNQLKTEKKVQEGHRYYSIMCLAAYAKKSGVSREELERDAFSLLKPFDDISQNENNRFTQDDIAAALEMFNDNYITLPIDTITRLTNIPIQKNRRRGLSRKQNLEIARKIKEVKVLAGDEAAKGGRKTKADVVLSWRMANPKGTKAECVRDTKLSKNTVYKHW